MGKLTDLQVKNAKPGKHSDGAGLYVMVTVSGGRLWRYDYRVGGVRKTLTLGKYPTVGLMDARLRHLEAVRSIEQGIDPMLERKRTKAASRVAADNTFKEVAAAWLAKTASTRMASTQARTARWLELELFPHIGSTPVDKITAQDVMAALRRMEARGLSDSMLRVKTITSRVMDFAMVEGFIQANPVNAIRNSDNFTTAQTKHHSAITDPVAFGGLLRAIRGYSGHATTRNAINLLALVFCRPGELRHLQWSWVNWKDSVIEVPAQAMKMRRDHVIPLSNQAAEILRQQQDISGHQTLVFPGSRGQGRTLSENTLNACLRASGFDAATHVAHGFRASARTLIVERLGCEESHIEAQLAHKPPTSLGRTYDRTRFLAQRSEMMQRWADYLDRLANGGEVVQLHRGAA